MRAIGVWAGIAILAAAAWAPARADVPRVQDVPVKEALPFPAGQEARSLVLKTAKARFTSPPTHIGELHDGLFCGKKGDITWTDRLFQTITPGLGKTFRGELEKAGYPMAPSASDTLFPTAADKEALQKRAATQLQVGALVKDVAANFCVRGGGSAQGGVYLRIFWQVFAPDEQKVIFEATTEGSYQNAGGETASLSSFFLRAFEGASRNLLAEPGFRDAVANMPVAAQVPVAAAATPSAEGVLHLAGSKAATAQLQGNLTLLRAAVATIVTNTGSGSGFFISTSGHLLTNQHVVGDSKFVKVKLPTGREILGEVVRVDRERDVALIRTEPAGIAPMPVRSSEANVGDDVYALGSPLGDRFNSTLTRGILSAYRTMENKRYLQSDVAILPGNSGGPLLDAQGNVLGITVAGLGARGMAGMNFFIPIGDALAKLGIELN
ncbi:trypsin-like peptidase domain-containing protein [Ramlibacter sp. G-1-2-2]|uniref:Trypsin-like peptidase domain-containing protein n=1 Tax=Ramlibacter agri TaxID=2728837 RepID=A0A848H9Z1_9BURK|nr:serine protease [Ramlibacter agri]NML47304.1 trypsin-like peptidase domain-containing protein [Ramlibacter agri]